MPPKGPVLTTAVKKTIKKKTPPKDNVRATDEGKKPSKKASAGPKKKRIVMMGNPGAGKSTILNSLIQSRNVVFRSGVTGGDGLTRKCESYSVKAGGYETTYVDTPGLAEFGAREEMAQEICKSIEPGIATVLCFVGLCPNGRLDSEFIKTVQTVMASFDREQRYVVVLNQYGPAVEHCKDQIERKYSQIFDNLCGLGAPTYIWVPMHNEAYGRNNERISGAALRNVQMINGARTTTSNGICIDLYKMDKQFQVIDSDYDQARDELVGEERILCRTDLSAMRAGAEPTPLSERRCFNKSRKAHCEHCVWWKLMTSREHDWRPADENSQDCLICVNL